MVKDAIINKVDSYTLLWNFKGIDWNLVEKWANLKPRFKVQ